MKVVQFLLFSSALLLSNSLIGVQSTGKHCPMQYADYCVHSAVTDGENYGCNPCIFGTTMPTDTNTNLLVVINQEQSVAAYVQFYTSKITKIETRPPIFI